MKTLLPRLLAVCLLLALGGCAVWSAWRPDNRYHDLPFANGRVVETMARSKSCGMCTTGSTGESAFFSGSKKYYKEDVGAQAEKIFAAFPVREGWKIVGEQYATKAPKYFSPVRVLLVSIDPIVIVTVPWVYKTPLDKGHVQHALFNEAESFLERDYSGKSKSFIADYWAEQLIMPIEIRGSLPAGTTQARVITEELDKTVAIPVDGIAAAVELGKYRLRFSRSPDGRVLIVFDTTH